MGDIFSTLSTAITVTRRLKEVGENIKDAEFKNLLADLSLELADAKLQLADILEENATLKKELQIIKSQSEEISDFILKDSMYYKENGDGPFCTGCYDTKRQPVRLAKQKSPFNTFGEFKCPACDEFYNSKI